MSAASDALHARVRRFGLDQLAHGAAAEAFEALALEIAAYQCEHNPVLRRLCAGRAPRALAEIPAVPADAFRLGRVASTPPGEDRARFQTSGTTGGAGVHAFRTLETYRELSVAWGGRCLFGEPAPGERCSVLGLAAPFEPEQRSSLGYMMQEFMRAFDGRALDGGAAFDAAEPGRWLLQAGLLDLDGLRRGAERAFARGERVVLLATSFALSWLLDALGGRALPLPPRSRVMQTGGFKGHLRTLDDAELCAALCAALALTPADVIGEYGMTELSSQLYDTGFGQGRGGRSVFREPPWLRVSPVDPVTLQPVAPGARGLACFLDLANVDSALCVLTEDEVQRVDGGLVLHGRRQGARLRGCSLAVEALAAGAAAAGSAA